MLMASDPYTDTSFQNIFVDCGTDDQQECFPYSSMTSIFFFFFDRRFSGCLHFFPICSDIYKLQQQVSVLVDPPMHTVIFIHLSCMFQEGFFPFPYMGL